MPAGSVPSGWCEHDTSAILVFLFSSQDLNFNCISKEINFAVTSDAHVKNALWGLCRTQPPLSRDLPHRQPISPTLNPSFPCLRLCVAHPQFFTRSHLIRAGEVLCPNVYQESPAGPTQAWECGPLCACLQPPSSGTDDS